ncbi:MAG TPA: energy transducer TonB [Allosphingosinicella sp.]
MENKRLASIALAALALGAAAPETPKKALLPAWQVTNSAHHDQCFITAYYRGEGLTVLMIRDSVGGPGIVVGNRNWRVPAGGRTRLTLQFDGSPARSSIDAENEVGSTHQGYSGDGEAGLLRRFADASAVRILIEDGRQLDYLELPALGRALIQLKQCSESLGPLMIAGPYPEGVFASAPIAPYPRRASADLTDVITDADYPPQALAAKQEGNVHFVMEVDAAGNMRCRVTRSSGWPLLDTTTCNLLEARGRGKFTHALDAEGNPTTDSRAGSYAWKVGRKRAEESEVPAIEE